MKNVSTQQLKIGDLFEVSYKNSKSFLIIVDINALEATFLCVDNFKLYEASYVEHNPLFKKLIGMS